MKMDNSLALFIGPSVLKNVGGMSSRPAAPLHCMAFTAVSSSRMVKDEQQDSAAVGNFSAFFGWWTCERSVLSTVTPQ